MSKRIVLISLIVIVLVVLSIFLITDIGLFTADTEKRADSPDLEEVEFTSTGDPYKDYNQARENEKPIVLEFYAQT